jgi:hypothetical protein
MKHLLTLTFLALIMAMNSQAAEGQYRHVVLFKFKDTSTKEDVKMVEAAFRALPSKIDTITDFEWGTDVSPEGKAQGFTHCFLVTFKDKAGLEVYIPHPAHKEFGKVAGPHFDKVLVIDFVSAK